MKARKTTFIGIAVTILSIVQMATDYSPVRLVSLFIGIFFIIFGWKIGWMDYPKFTVMLGHIAIVIGCLLIAYGIYQIPFLENAPTMIEVLDLPLFWGLFTMWSGSCMIKHSYCSCVRRMHLTNNK